MRWAITSYGVGNKVGWRAVDDDWPLEDNEVFFISSSEFDKNKVLSSNKLDLELPQKELL